MRFGKKRPSSSAEHLSCMRPMTPGNGCTVRSYFRAIAITPHIEPCASVPFERFGMVAQPPFTPSNDPTALAFLYSCEPEAGVDRKEVARLAETGLTIEPKNASRNYMASLAYSRSEDAEKALQTARQAVEVVAISAVHLHAGPGPPPPWGWRRGSLLGWNKGNEHGNTNSEMPWSGPTSVQCSLMSGRSRNS